MDAQELARVSRRLPARVGGRDETHHEQLRVPDQPDQPAADEFDELKQRGRNRAA